MTVIANAGLVLKDSQGNEGIVKTLTDNDIIKISNAITDVGHVVDPATHMPIEATTASVGVVQLATAQDIKNGTANKVVDAKELADALAKVGPGGGGSSSLDYSDFFLDGAPQHNCIYRGKDITADFESGKFSENVANGTFKDIFVGDYIQGQIFIDPGFIPVNWIVGDCDYALYHGRSQLTTHHVLVFPDVPLDIPLSLSTGPAGSGMNKSNTTSGGYLGSYMYKTVMPYIRARIKEVFGAGHVCSFQEYLTNAVNTSMASMAGGGLTGASSGAAWTTVDTCDLMCESMVFGSKISSSYYDRCEFPKIISAFKYNPKLISANLAGRTSDWWLRDVVSSSNFAYVSRMGTIESLEANPMMTPGVRPFVLIK